MLYLSALVVTNIKHSSFFKMFYLFISIIFVIFNIKKLNKKTKSCQLFN